MASVTQVTRSYDPWPWPGRGSEPGGLSPAERLTDAYRVEPDPLCQKDNEQLLNRAAASLKQRGLQLTKAGYGEDLQQLHTAESPRFFLVSRGFFGNQLASCNLLSVVITC
jgi:hypothetical protein